MSDARGVPGAVRHLRRNPPALAGALLLGLFYLLAGVPFVAWLFFTRDRVLRLTAVVAFLMLVQDNIIGRRYLTMHELHDSHTPIYQSVLASTLVASESSPPHTSALSNQRPAR